MPQTIFSEIQNQMFFIKPLQNKARFWRARYEDTFVNDGCIGTLQMVVGLLGVLLTRHKNGVGSRFVVPSGESKGIQGPWVSGRWS